MSRGMGQAGVDCILSPAALKLFRSVLGKNLAIECKAVESLVVPTTYFEHAAKYPDDFSVLVHKRNKTEPLVTIRLTDFIRLITPKTG